MPETHSIAAEFRELPVTVISESTWNPRKHFNDATLSELADSIRAKGVIEPILVRQVDAGSHRPKQYEIIAGARRHRASVLAGRETIPALIHLLDDVGALELAVIENGQRDDIHPLDEAEGYEALSKADKKFSITTLAAKVGKSESYIYRRLALLKLDPTLRTALAEDRLDLGHAEKLCRLSPALQEEAADLNGRGVVWSRSPLLDYDEKWVPGRDDLMPLATLEKFIRDKSHFDPASEVARHFQPELAEQLDAVVEGAAAASDTDLDALDEERVLESLVSLSDDPMARSRLGAKKGEPVPITPHHWREVKGEKKRCEFTVKGVITHGGPARVLDVCITKRCKKHFPPAKKAKPSRSSASSAPAQPVEQSWEREDRLRKEAQAAWAPIWPHVKPALVAHTAKIKLTAALVLTVLRANTLYGLRGVEHTFDVKFTDATMGQVFALCLFERAGNGTKAEFLKDAKLIKFDLGPVEAKLKADAKKAAAPAKAKRGARA